MQQRARALFDGLSWHVRGVFATEANRRLGFWARDLWQPAEVNARRGLARELATELDPDLTFDTERGHRVLAPEKLPELQELCGSISLSASATANGAIPGGKQFSRNKFAGPEQMEMLVRIALDRRLVAMTAAYFGVVPVLADVDIYRAVPVTGPFTKSQLWHCDDDSARVLKIFIYCDAVTEDDGPFELIEPEASREVRRAIGYRFAGRRYRVQDDEMDALVPKTAQQAMLGPRGTAFAVDTVACFHRGSRITKPGRHRVAAIICYCPPSSTKLPRRLAWANAPLTGFASLAKTETDRAVLGLPMARRWA